MSSSINKSQMVKVNEEYCRILVENSLEGFFVFDSNKKILFANQKISEMLGYSVDELVNLDSSILLEDRFFNQRIKQKKSKNGGVDRFESRLKRKDDSVFPVEVRLGCFDSKTEQVYFMFVQDISESEAARKELQEKERQVSTLMANLPGMVYRCKNDRNWTMEFVSEGCLALTGYSAADLTSNKIFYNDLIVAEDRKLVFNQVQESITKKLPFHFSYRILTEKGDIKWVWEQGRAIVGANNEIIALEGYISDITETMRANENLQQANERFKMAALAANFGVWEWNIETNQLIWDDRMYELYEVTKENFSPFYENWSSLLHPDDKSGSDEAMKLALTGEKYYDTTFRVVLADGTTRHIKTFGQVLRSFNGQPVRMIGVNYDVSEVIELDTEKRLMIETQALISHSKDEEEICKVVGQKLQGLIDNSIIAVNFLDDQAQGLKLVGLYSPDHLFEALTSRFEIEPLNKLFHLQDMTDEALQLYRSSELTRYEKGLYRLFGRKISKVFCDVIEKELKYTNIYSIGFVCEQLNFGGITILTKRDLSPVSAMIETLVGQATNAIDRLRSEKALRESEARFRRIFEESQIGIGLSNLDYQFTSVNNEFIKIWGYSEEELLKLTFREITYPDDLNVNIEGMKKLKAGEISVFTTEKRYICKNGSIMWGRVTVSAIRDVNGSVLAFLAMVENIDERKRAEQALEYERNQMQVLMDSTLDSVYFKDLQNRFIRVNRGTAVKFGFKEPEEILGKSDFDIFKQETAQEFFDEENEIIRTGIPVIGSEEIEIWPDRPLTWASFSKILVKDGTGKIIGTFGISRDITDRKRKEEEIKKLNADLEKKVELRTKELRLKNQELEAFTYTVSHDLKAPLRGISGYSTLLLQDHASQLDDEGKNFLHKLILSADQLGQLIDDLLSYSRLERRTISWVELTVEDILKSVLEQNSRDIAQQNVAVHLNVEREVINSCPELMTQILQNLVDNTLKFTKKVEHPEIWVDYKNQGETSLFSIRDNGVGFDMANHDKIFEVFQRLHRVRGLPGYRNWVGAG